MADVEEICAVVEEESFLVNKTIEKCDILSSENAGTEDGDINDDYTYDCWKCILHDDDPNPSTGRSINEIAADYRIRGMFMAFIDGQEYPKLQFVNLWDEVYDIIFFPLPSGRLVAHANFLGKITYLLDRP
uniref:Uncharacterized protein n=1 Tax=Panagrolaimus sp. ES5 TaxID=591445 RepID=A0AC34GIW4_9BILA